MYKIFSVCRRVYFCWPNLCVILLGQFCTQRYNLLYWGGCGGLVPKEKVFKKSNRIYCLLLSINGIDMLVFNIEAVCTRVFSGHADQERKGLMCVACGEVSTAQILLHQHDPQERPLV